MINILIPYADIVPIHYGIDDPALLYRLSNVCPPIATVYFSHMFAYVHDRQIRLHGSYGNFHVIRT